jgi:micrococcal nuclease
MYEYSARATRVIDGDTVALEIDLGLNVRLDVRVRLYAVNTPETHGVKRDTDEYRRGSEATGYVKSAIEGREVVVQTVKDRTGKFGRYLVVIWFRAGGMWHNLNKALVENDMAVADDNYERMAEYRCPKDI